MLSHACYLLENTQEPRELQQRCAEQFEETKGCKDLRRCENIPIIHQDKHTNTRETNLHGKTKWNMGNMSQGDVQIKQFIWSLQNTKQNSGQCQRFLLMKEGHDAMFWPQVVIYDSVLIDGLSFNLWALWICLLSKPLCIWRRETR